MERVAPCDGGGTGEESEDCVGGMDRKGPNPGAIPPRSSLLTAHGDANSPPWATPGQMLVSGTTLSPIRKA